MMQRLGAQAEARGYPGSLSVHHTRQLPSGRLHWRWQQTCNGGCPAGLRAETSGPQPKWSPKLLRGQCAGLGTTI